MKKYAPLATLIAVICATGLWLNAQQSIGNGVWWIGSTGQGTVLTQPPINCMNCTAIPGGQINAGSITSTQLAANTTQFVSIPLTLSQLQTLNSVGVSILPAQGAGTMIEMQSCILDLKYGSAAFTGGGAVTIGYGSTSATTNAMATTIAATFWTTFAASHTTSVLAGAIPVTANTSLQNLGIWMNAATADFAAGTGATGQVDCSYRVHNVI